MVGCWWLGYMLGSGDGALQMLRAEMKVRGVRCQSRGKPQSQTQRLWAICMTASVTESRTRRRIATGGAAGCSDCVVRRAG